MTGHTIRVHTPESSYPVVIDTGVLDDVGAIAGRLGLGQAVAIATDTTVAPLQGARVAAALGAAGWRAWLVTMPAGEPHKGWAALDGYIRGFAEGGLDRAGWVLALGGGVVGDTAGLAAALYMRGVPLVQAPTTLLAMADASVGGKVAIDHPLGKNLAGVFKQPVAVLADLATLATLPAAEIANGMAEIVKAAIIDGSGGVGRASDRRGGEDGGGPAGPGGPSGPSLQDLVAGGVAPSATMLALAVDVKRRLVEADPYEQNIRALLNLGHTFGHAFERLSGYTLRHGFAVAQGMMAAAHLAEALGLAAPTLTAQTGQWLAAYGLPLRWGARLPPGTDPAAVLAAMATDKKRVAGRLRFVLARAAGDVRVECDVPEAAVLAALAATRMSDE